MYFAMWILPAIAVIIISVCALGGWLLRFEILSSIASTLPEWGNMRQTYVGTHGSRATE